MNKPTNLTKLTKTALVVVGITVSTLIALKYYERPEYLDCGSPIAVNLIQNMAESKDSELDYVKWFVTLDDSASNSTMCKAMFKTKEMQDENIIKYTISVTDDEQNIFLELL